jgi:adenine-specific DNA-methyltransferase
MSQRIYKHYGSDRQLVFFEDDCRKLLKTLPDASVDLVVSSPPYCMNKEYDTADTPEEFRRMHAEIFPDIFRVLKRGGNLCWQVGSHVRSNTVVPLDYLVYDLLQGYSDLKLRNRIIWTFGHGLHLTRRFSGRHEVVLWYSKGDEYLFNLDSVRVAQKYPGKRRYKGPRKGEYSGNPEGKNPSDVWAIPNVKACHVEKTDHPCQFPVALAKRLIDALTPPGGTVLDPFAGSATTGVAAILSGRKFIGAEIYEPYVNLARERLRAALDGSIRYRPEFLDIREPQAGEAVSRRPAHFANKFELL